MSSNPDQIKAEIEATRAGLSRDVDALAQAVSPSNVVARQREKVAGTVSGVRDKASSAVFGAKDAVLGQASQAQFATGGALQSTGEAITSSPQVAIQRAQGNPLAAGMIALGAGWLLGSLLPATRAERQAAESLKEKAAPLVQEASNLAKESVQNLQEPANEAFAQVKSTSTEALQTVREEAGTTASDVAGTAKEGAQNVRASTSG